MRHYKPPFKKHTVTPRFRSRMRCKVCGILVKTARAIIIALPLFGYDIYCSRECQRKDVT